MVLVSQKAHQICLAEPSCTPGNLEGGLRYWAAIQLLLGLGRVGSVHPGFCSATLKEYMDSP